MSSTVNLNVDLDIMLCVLAQALLAALRTAPNLATPPSPPTPCNAGSSKPPAQIITNGDTITVRLDRRAYTPVLRHADLPKNTARPLVGKSTPYASNSAELLVPNLLRGIRFVMPVRLTV